MITSMTGYGRGEEVIDGYEAVVEIRSLNHRFLDVAMRLPRSLSSYEESIKEIVRKYVDRGRVNVAVTLKNEGQQDFELKIDARLAVQYKKMLEQLSLDLDLQGPVTIDHILHFSDILTPETQEEVGEQGWHCAKQATEQALQNLNAMRQREGLEIANDLRRRIHKLQEKIDLLEKRTTSRRRDEFDRLYSRLIELVGSKELDPTRLELEVAILADRVDVSEECTRFRSHNTLFLEATDNEGAAGRKLNFLLQEMNREVNTIGSKASDAQISHYVVEMKEEIEKLREQVQNIE